MKNQKKIKYILFDMDGVLIDSMKYHISSWKKAFENAGIHPKESELKQLAGVSFKETVEIITKKYKKALTEKQKNQIYEDKKKNFENTFEPELFKNIQENLKKLKQKGFKLALVSGSIGLFVQKVTQKYFKETFDVIVTGSDVKTGKPSPEPYFLAQKQLKAKKEECIIVEDAPKGIESGKNANICVFALETTFPKDKLQDADRVFKNHEELFEYLIVD